MLQTYTIPNLSQGVSQQPDAQRDPTQGEIQVNGVSSISEGLRKRDSTRTIAKVSNSKFGDAYIHTILRDTTEEYLAVITSSGIKVFDLEGTEFSVTTDATDGYNYLSGITDARTQLRAQTIADYTFVTNRTTLVKMDTATAPETPRPKPYEALDLGQGRQLRPGIQGDDQFQTVHCQNADPAGAVRWPGDHHRKPDQHRGDRSADH